MGNNILKSLYYNTDVENEKINFNPEHLIEIHYFCGEHFKEQINKYNNSNITDEDITNICNHFFHCNNIKKYENIDYLYYSDLKLCIYHKKMTNNYYTMHEL
jgi:hypothetical protein